MRSKVTKLIPKKCRIWIRGLPVLSLVLNRRQALQYATTTKRLDECLNEFAEINRMTGFGPRDKVCLEIGAGWVLSHSLAMYVLGARAIISTDINRLAFPEMLSTAVNGAADKIDWDKLASLGDVREMKSRFEHLRSIKKFTFKILDSLGVEYVAPIDLAERALGRPVDFIYSHAVLEHVPTQFALPLIRNLAADLTENGRMYHGIHLEDHESKDAPFAFFSESARAYIPRIQSARGNRIRKSGWNRIFSQIDGVSFQYIIDKPNTEAGLPEKIDPSVEYTDELDLRSAHLSVWAVKKPAATQPA